MGYIKSIDNDYHFLIYNPDTDATDWVALTEGQVVLINDILTFAIKDWETNDVSITMVTQDMQARGTKATGTGSSISAGEKVYWDATNEVVTTTSTGNTWIGWCIRDAADADETVDIDYDGNLRNVA
jgi:predicted RecA/RadA family phage recombinase